MSTSKSTIDDITVTIKAPSGTSTDEIQTVIDMTLGKFENGQFVLAKKREKKTE